MITLDGVTLKLGKKQILDDINYTFSSGKTYGIIGTNGAGKTTLLNCISGLNNQFNGNISITPEFRHSISYLESTLIFHDRMKAGEFVQLCLRARNITGYDINAACQSFELPAHEFIDMFSSGMKKKLMLLVFLLIKDKVILLDEPFANLDAEAIHLLTEAILRIKEMGSTVIITSHDIGSLLNCSDRLLLINGGKIHQDEDAANAGEMVRTYQGFLEESKQTFLTTVGLG